MVELRPNLSPTVYSLLVLHLATPLLVCGAGIKVKGMVEELV